MSSDVRVLILLDEFDTIYQGIRGTANQRTSSSTSRPIIVKIMISPAVWDFTLNAAKRFPKHQQKNSAVLMKIRAS